MIYAGSHYKNQKGLIEWFTEQRDENGHIMYNCTGLVWNDNSDLKTKDNLHLYRLPDNKIYNEEILSAATTLEEIIGQLMPFYEYELSLVNERRHILDDLKTENFDLVFIDVEFTEAKVAGILDAPIMQ